MAERNRPKTAGKKFIGCSYAGEDFCRALKKCQAQALLDNSADLGDNAEATQRRNAIEEEAKAHGCTEDLKKPFAE